MNPTYICDVNLKLERETQLFITSLHFKLVFCPFFLAIFISQMEKCKNILLHRAFTFEVNCNFNISHIVRNSKQVFNKNLHEKSNCCMITLFDDQYACCISC